MECRTVIPAHRPATGRRTLMLRVALVSCLLLGCAAASQAGERLPLLGPGEDQLAGPFTYRARLERTAAGRGGGSAVLVTFTIPVNTHLLVETAPPTPRLEPAPPFPEGLRFGAPEAPPPLNLDLDLTPEVKDPAAKQIEKGVPVYQKEVTLRLPFVVAPGAAPGPRKLAVGLSYSGCEERPKYQCFLPGEAKLLLDFTVLDRVDERPVTLPAVAGPSRDRERAAGTPLADARGSDVPPPIAASPAPASFMARGPIADLAAAHSAGRYGVVLWGLFLAGLASILLPCVYPLVPITLSVIGVRRAGKRWQATALAAAYGLGIMAVYVLLGLVAGLAGGLFSRFIDYPAVVLAISALCAVLALSMFGAFELALPSAWQTRLARFGGEGYAGAVVMGALSGVLASACVGPALLFILALIAQTGSAAQGALYLFVYSLGFALPYMVIGATAAGLPKPGAWMGVIKNIGGLILLVVSVYYASKVIPAYASLLLGGVLAVTVGVFAGAFDVLTPGSGTWPRALKSFGLIAVALGVFALVGAALNLGFFGAPAAATAGAPVIAWRHDGAEAVRAAVQAGKPAILDFVSDTCTICKVIENSTLADPRVVAESRHFVMIKVDTTGGRARDLVQRYAVRGLPTIVFLNGNGEERRDLAVQGGYVAAEDFLAKMMDLLTGGG